MSDGLEEMRDKLARAFNGTKGVREAWLRLVDELEADGTKPVTLTERSLAGMLRFSETVGRLAPQAKARIILDEPGE